MFGCNSPGNRKKKKIVSFQNKNKLLSLVREYQDDETSDEEEEKFMNGRNRYNEGEMYQNLLQSFA